MSRPGRKRARGQADVSLEGSADDSGMADDDRGDDDERQQSHWELPEGYDDRNRAFLQAFLAHGVLTLKQAQFLLASILNVERLRKRQREDGAEEEDGDEEGGEAPLRPDEILIDDLREFVGKAQQALAPLDLDIRTAVDQTRNERLWALVSTDHDAKSHLAVLLTPRKLAFVNRLLVAIFDTYNTPRIEALCLTEQQALKLSRPPRSRQSDVGGDAGSASQAANRDKGLKHSVVLSLLQSLVRQGWFEKSAAGFFTPTTRTLLELEPVLVEAFNDGSGSNTDTWQRIKYCAACKDILTTGLRCTTVTCTLRLHDRCETAFWRTQAAAAGGNRTCPRCQAAWNHAGDGDGEDGEAAAQHFIGERAITLTDVYKRKKRQGRPSEGVDELMRALLPRTLAPVHIPLVGGRASTGADDDMAEEDEEEEADAEAEAEAEADDTGV